MRDFKFSLWNKIVGWAAFVVAFITYALTVEPTASFWDPGEFITVSSRLQIGHPPGAPLFQMLGAFLSIFAIDDHHIALMVNYVSVLTSALTILFMFWALTMLIQKISGPARELKPGAKIAVLGSALVGSLAFAFTDSFWFSAVEAEVYATAMCFMSAMFYVGLLWERDMYKPRGNRWLVLLGFLIGLTFGVHFLGLLTIPAIGYLYYFKHVEKVTVKNFIIASVIVIGVLLFLFLFLMPYTLSFFAGSEIFFVNDFGLPFNSGTIIAALVMAALFYFILRYTRKKGYTKINSAALFLLFIYIGFSSWMLLPIRANANVNINENDPNNARELLAYYNREQYPSNPLLYGPQYTKMFAGLDRENPYVDDKPKYEKDEKAGKYVIVNDYHDAVANLSDKQKTFLPRMWSTDDPEYPANYVRLTAPPEFHIKPEYSGVKELQQAVKQLKEGYANGDIDADDLIKNLSRYQNYLDIEKPSTASNFQFMFQYQFWYMYFRYFMWNFAGRQNDEKGEYTNENGNWISGIPFVDSYVLRSQKDMPDFIKNNPSRNTYFLLPLILGLIGLFFQYDRDKRNFWVIMALFLFTGLAIKVYLNERPFEPRERDYAVVGSFYAFALWIGFGVYSLYDKLKKYVTPKIVAPAITVICLVAVPVLLAAQSWNDHDRSGKYTATAMAKNYLDSVGKNGILFTVGDNDTFPLWYVQEVEGYRTDVRIINTSLYATDWYIDQMKRATAGSAGIKTTLQHKNYTYGTNDQIQYQEDPRLPDTLGINDWLKYIKSDNPSTRVQYEDPDTKQVHTTDINAYPTKHLILPVNKQNVLKNHIVDKKDADKILSEIPINIKANYIGKNTLMMLDLVANLDWSRPVYFSGGSFGGADFLWMKDYLELDGMCYKLVPIKTKAENYQMGRIDADKLFKKIMNWHWGNSGDPNMYYDPVTRRNTVSYRIRMTRLVDKLIREDKKDKAEQVLDLAQEKMPVNLVGYATVSYPFIDQYYEIGNQEKARKLWDELAGREKEKAHYYAEMSLNEQEDNIQGLQETLYRYHNLVETLMKYDEEKADREVEIFNKAVMKFGGGEEQLEMAPDKDTNQGPPLPERDSTLQKPVSTQ